MSGPASEATKIVVIGAGPAGLTAAWRLAQREIVPMVLEADEAIGGLSRTWRRDGWLLDAGGHRFFTQVPEIEAIWRELLDDQDLLRRKRRSGFLFDGVYHAYPLNPSDVISSMAPWDAARCVASLAWARVHPRRITYHHFEAWARAHFGRRLYALLYKPYTEKVWGLSPTQISAEWAAQRIKVPPGLSVLLQAALGRSKSTESLEKEFLYPRHGPGMLWERLCSRIQAYGIQVLRRSPVVEVHLQGGRVVGVSVDVQGTKTAYEADQVISSMPLAALVRAVEPAAPTDVRHAADALRHRNLLVVALVVPDRVGFPYNWIYVPGPATRVGRIQNYRSWSPDLVHAGLNALGMEYFLGNDDPLWTLEDEELVHFAARELAKLEIAPATQVHNGYVLRVPMAYPVYDQNYRHNVGRIREWLEASAVNLHPVGRNGMHKYNNQDHSMLTAMLTVENLFGARHNVWSVNTGANYHEERSLSQLSKRGRRCV
jgi:protoporphyrinogen oxidase